MRPKKAKYFLFPFLLSSSGMGNGNRWSRVQIWDLAFLLTYLPVRITEMDRWARIPSSEWECQFHSPAEAMLLLVREIVWLLCCAVRIRD